jgi:hypothetical protein
MSREKTTWAVDWYAYPPGARVSSHGTEYIQADSAIQAESIVKARWPGVDEVSARRAIVRAAAAMSEGQEG